MHILPIMKQSIGAKLAGQNALIFEEGNTLQRSY